MNKDDVKIVIIFIAILWAIITVMQWLMVANYDPCGDPNGPAGSWHNAYWCAQNSRYTLVETIYHQYQWLASLRVV